MCVRACVCACMCVRACVCVQSELELLVMSDDGDGEERQHFNMPSIMRSEKEAKKKRKKRKMEKKREARVVSDFKVNVTDDRFQALYESQHYAPDPSAPQYR